MTRVKRKPKQPKSKEEQKMITTADVDIGQVVEKALIKIDLNENQEPIVSGRELHNALGIETPYRKWMPRMINYGFEENVEYTPDKFVHPQNNQEVLDHILKLDMAKEIAMIQRNEKGKQIRQYFIRVEKKYNSPEKVMARALKIADDEIKNLQLVTVEQTKQIQVMKPKALFADAVATSKTSVLIGELAKVLKQNDIEIGQNRLFEWLRSKGYLMSRKGESWNMPTQKSMDLGLLEIKVRTINNPDGSIRTTKTPKVTGKGQIYFVNKFLKMIGGN